MCDNIDDMRADDSIADNLYNQLCHRYYSNKIKHDNYYCFIEGKNNTYCVTFCYIDDVLKYYWYSTSKSEKKYVSKYYDDVIDMVINFVKFMKTH